MCVEQRLITAGLVALVAATSASGQLRIPSSIAPLPPSSCRLGVAAERPDEVADVIRSANLPRRTIYLRSTAAGKWLRLQGDVLDRGRYRVTVRAKWSGETRLGTTVCRNVRWSPSRGPLVATDPRQSPGSVWQVELAVEGRSGSRKLVLYREPGSASGPDSDEEGPADLFALSCDDWSPTSPVQHREGGFASRVRLDVDPPPATASFGALQRDAVSRLVLEAAALWVRACRECQPENLVVVVVDGRLFIRPGLQRWLETFKPVDIAAPGHAQAELGDDLENNVYLHTGPADERIKSLEAYVPAEPLSQAITRLCTADLARGPQATLTAVRAALCLPGTLPREQRARIEVRVRPLGATYCGNDREIIACRADDTLTELNARDFRFRARPNVVFGAGDVDLDLLPVLVHEMGHWIGLRHIDRGASIMASTMDRARCIDETTVAALAANLVPEGPTPQAFRLHDAFRRRWHTRFRHLKHPSPQKEEHSSLAPRRTRCKSKQAACDRPRNHQALTSASE